MQKTQNIKALNELKKIVPKSCIFSDEENLFKASIDHSRLSQIPDLVIKPDKEELVGQILKIANTYKIPITPRGAGTSCTGSSVPIKKGWVLDLSKINFIKIDKTTRTAFVGAGAITGEVIKKAQEENLFYPPDPSSLKFSTIGGNISTNAGGLKVAKYGPTRDYVISINAYLANGQKITCSKNLRKFSAGYNLRDLLISSEGTLAVITSAYLKLIEKPKYSKTFLLFFENDNAALCTVKNLLKLLTPSILEFLDSQCVSLASKYENLKLLENYENYSLLLTEIDDFDIEEKSKLLTKFAKKYSTKFLVATDKQEANKLWQARRICSSAMYLLADTKISEDVCVASDKADLLIEKCSNISKKTNLHMPIFGHAADGNYHLHIMYNSSSKQEEKTAILAMQEIMEFVVSIEGAISGEHGIGLTKENYMNLQFSNTELDLMKKIKNTLDPFNILNPDKLFYKFDQKKLKPLKNIKLPWDKK